MSDDPFEYIMPNWPTEILEMIFSSLKPDDMFKCRRVCTRWRLIIDNMLRSHNRWRTYCELDFPHIYKIAYNKQKADLTWMSLYRSLRLWSKIQNTTETQNEFAVAHQVPDEMADLQIIRGEEIGVLTKRGIIYHNFNTLKPSSRGVIAGDYLRYFENDQVILILAFTSDLYIIRKLKRSPNQANYRLDSVKCFLLIDETLYYVKLNNEIYLCNVLHEEICSNLILQIGDSIMCLSNKNGVNILTFQRNIYSIRDNKISFQKTLNDSSNLLDTLNHYDFLDHLDWRVFFQWIYILKREMPAGAMRDIVSVKVYGDIVFVGSNSGILRIYLSPIFNNEFDLFNTKPIKEYNFTEQSDSPVLTVNPIVKIDVIEGIDSHSVLVCMNKKVVVLNLKHNIIESPIGYTVGDEEELGLENLNI